ncbi:MAG TPA: MerR family transcriptional regulator [Candidatus Egerieimonas intestinavium]|uniref:MerR family transcriptional regulator n=1 Tax=Candidatus Egerieimonas intestinavium TaxID=2840777 RepID=A0A9D1EIS8_9FIRM|nr:MerR family transcriptional regulator [Candidatus Egerieimonas intestinavium]
MSDTGYLISEAAKITQVDAHVLRYWEEELELPIARNKMGHRYYTRQDIQTFQDIKELKKKGLQLRAIKEIVHQRMEAAGTVERQKQLRAVSPEGGAASPGGSSKVVSISILEKEGMGKDKSPEEEKPLEKDKAPEAEKLPGKDKAPEAEKLPGKDKSSGKKQRKNQPEREAAAPLESQEADQLLRQRQFQEILERLVKQVIVANHQEGRYKRLDAAIRRHQESRRLVAATEEERKKRRNGKKAKGKNRTASGGNDS